MTENSEVSDKPLFKGFKWFLIDTAVVVAAWILFMAFRSYRLNAAHRLQNTVDLIPGIIRVLILIGTGVFVLGIFAIITIAFREAWTNTKGRE